MVKLFFDPGHGGRDGGAAANGIREKDISLKIALGTGKRLEEEYEAEVVYSRTTDGGIPLRDRALMAIESNADLFISFHSNGFTDSNPNGYEDFLSPSPTLRTIEIRDKFHDEVASVWTKHNRRNRGKKRANFSVLRNTTMPAILVENGFLTNTSDAELLKDDTFLNELISGHVEGVAKALNLKRRR